MLRVGGSRRRGQETLRPSRSTPRIHPRYRSPLRASVSYLEADPCRHHQHPEADSRTDERGCDDQETEHLMAHGSFLPMKNAQMPTRTRDVTRYTPRTAK